jgi:transposase-like protein
MAYRNPNLDQATIDRAVSMVTGGEGHRKRTLRAVAAELGVSHMTVQRWVHRAARQAMAAPHDPPGEHVPQPLPRAPGGSDPAGILTEIIDHHRVECERLSRENAALKATIVLLARDLDDRESTVPGGQPSKPR